MIADKTANPDWIAADLLAQAEHGHGSQAILLTDSEKILAATAKSIERQTKLSKRPAELAKALSISDAKARSEVMKRLEEIMQEQGVMVQPYWRSIYRHFDPKVKGADMHATFEHHHYKWSIAAA